ncbi:MAG: hypothetical protein JEY99_16460 [Spirochaetales bacterium]|nr:hypothetical protein [Spirochaetales bacterium]
MIIRRIRIVLCLILFSSFLYAETIDILILHSYHEGFTWTDEMNSAIQGNLKETITGAEFFVEYMDSKRVSPKILFPNLLSLYKTKYGDHSIDLIVSTDNNAFEFLKMYRDDIFGIIPLVFCGVNNFTDDQLDGFSRVTGVTESTDLSGTIDLILELEPETTHIAGVTDATPTGLIHIQDFSRIQPLLKGRVELISLGNLTEAELKRAMGDLPEHTSIIYFSFFKDRAGKDFTIAESVSMVSSSTDHSVYILWDWGLGLGPVGGIVTSGKKQGEEAAGMAFRILSGEGVEAVPVLKESPNVPMFDYNVLPKIDVDISDLPDRSVIINQPENFYKENKVLIWAVVSVFLVLLILILSLSYDINRRHKAEKNLSEQKSILKDTLDHIPIYVHWKDSEGNILGCNNGFRERFLPGYEADGGDSFRGRLLFSREERELFEKLEGQVDEERKPLLFQEFHIEAYSGGDTDYLITIIPFNDPESPLNLISLIQDISQRREMEIQLKQSQKMEALGQLAGGIAHDFNNLLTAIVGSAEMISDGIEPSSDLHQFLEMIFETSDGAHGLINGLLSYSRKAPLIFSNIQVRELVESSVILLKVALDKTIKIEINELTPGLQVMGDSAMLQSVLINLGINAGDAMSDGGELVFKIDKIGKNDIPVEVLELSSEDYLLLVVADNGEGIQPEILEKLFDPFFTTKPVEKGTGLGLAGAYGCIKSHNGQIVVKSELHKGTVFEIYLPLTRSAVEV